ncbi:MAG: hypothetical protein WCO75_04925 [Planctomycetota bacterium]
MARNVGYLFAACSAAIALAGGSYAWAQAPATVDPGAAGDVLARPAPGVDELMKRLETLEDRNRELETRVTDLNRQQGEEWLGEQRAGQIRDIVRDVLADSDQRTSLQGSGMTAGWNDGFFLASADGRFRMNLGGFMQNRFTSSTIRPGSYNGANPAQQAVFDRKETRYGFNVPDLQVWADGHVFSRDFQYMVKARFYEQVTTNINKGDTSSGSAAIAGGPDFSQVELMDAWIRINLDDNWSVRTGQYRSPFSRGFLVLEQYQMSSARSVVDFHYALGYTQGIELEYTNDEFRSRTSIDSGAQDNMLGDVNAVYGGNGYKLWPTGSFGSQNAQFWEQNSAYSVTHRFDWKPAGSWDQFRSYTSPSMETFAFLAGLGLHYQSSRGYQANEDTPGVKNPESQWFTATIDAQANFGGASVYGAVFYNYVNAPAALQPAFGDAQDNVQYDLGTLNMVAAQLQASMYIMPKAELFGRYEFAYIDGGTSTLNNINPEIANPDPLNLLTIGVNYYLDGQDLKWTTDLGWAITAVNPLFSDVNAGWRPSRSDEIVFRTQLQLIF